MPALHAQLPWRRFVCVLRKLGYTAQKGKAGAARAFTNPNRVPKVISMHKPHPGKNLGAMMLRSIFRNFSSMKMSSCICSKTARSDAQTTARGHPDLACENSVRPTMRLAASLD